MSLTKDQIKSAALQLDPTDREKLAEELLLSIMQTDRQSVDAAWLEEAYRRDAAFQRGEAQARPVGDIIARLQNGARR